MKIDILPPFNIDQDNPNAFHPSVAPLADGRLMMTFQSLRNSDCYGNPRFAFSDGDLDHWYGAADIPGMETRQLAEGFYEGIADVRPFAAPDGKAVAVIGCNTHYTVHGAAFWDQSGSLPAVPRHRHAAYAIYRPDRGWSQPRVLRDPAMRPEQYWRIACAQVAFTPEGDWLLPCYFEHGEPIDYAGFRSPCFAVRTLKARLEGDEFRVLEWGNILSSRVRRGLIEPSVIAFENCYYLTIRAEDGCGYYSVSPDGIHWPEPKAWQFDDGTMLATDSTQQHFLAVGGKLYLLYTRDAGFNRHLMRFRAPLFIAEIDPATIRLRRATEAVALPLAERKGMPGLLGNFHAVPLPDGRGVITDARMFLQVEGDSIIEREGELAFAVVHP